MNINPEIIGFVAGGLSSALFIPQIVKILKEKSAEEIASKIHELEHRYFPVIISEILNSKK